MTAVGARNRKKAIMKIRKKVKLNSQFLYLERPLKILLKSAIQIRNQTDFCKNPNPIQKFDGLPYLNGIQN